VRRLSRAIHPRVSAVRRPGDRGRGGRRRADWNVWKSFARPLPALGAAGGQGAGGGDVTMARSRRGVSGPSRLA